MKSKRPSDQVTAAEAAEWHVRQEQLGKDEQRAFAGWLKESPRHLREFLIMETLGEELRHVDPQRRHDVEALLAEPESGVLSMFEPRPDAAPRASLVKKRWNNKHLRRVAAVAIAVGIAAMAIFVWRPPQIPGGWQDYTTAVGEQRTIRLPDNSIVNLNTGSRLRLNFSARARDLRLLEGEALFKVQHDAARPFRVYTRDAIVQAIGTQFNVYARANDTTVSVLEGRVRVVPERSIPEARESSAALSTGEEADIGRDGYIKRRARPDITNLAAWRQRRLVFQEDTLAHIATEFNRYNRSPKIRLEGIDGSTQHYTGTFDADNPQALALLLSRQSDLTIETTSTEIVIRPR